MIEYSLVILFCFGISSSPKVISTGELGRLLDWVIDGLFIDIFVSFWKILLEFVVELWRDVIHGDWVIELEFTFVKSSLRWEEDKNEFLYCDTVVFFSY